MWMLGEVPEGACERCLLLPSRVVELMCGHSLCCECMRAHARTRGIGRSCAACAQKTIRPESAWVRLEAPLSALERAERLKTWEREKCNPIVVVYDVKPAYARPPSAAPQPPSAASPATPSPTPVLSTTPPPTTPADIQASAAAQPSASEQEELRLALDQMRGKLLKQACAIDEVQQQHAEHLAEQHVRHKLELSMVGRELRAEEDPIASLQAATAQAEMVCQDRVASLQQRVASLQQQIGGGNWLSAVGNAKRDAATVKQQQATIDELSRLAGGPRLRAKGDHLQEHLKTDAGARQAGLLPELQAEPPSSEKDVGLTPQRVDQLAAHLEQQLFATGAGKVDRTRLLVSALLKRPAVQRLLSTKETHMERLDRAARKMVDSAAGVLSHLTTAKRGGSRSTADHERFEAIVAALTPDDADSLHLISTICELLGTHHEQIERAQVN